MTRYTRSTFVVAILVSIAGCAHTTHSPAKPKRLVVSPLARNSLSFLYDNLSVEFAFCAYGKQTKDLVWVERVDLPRISQATPDFVFFGSCRKKDLLGFGHSHPPPYICELSDLDVKTFLEVRDGYSFLVCPSGIKAYTKSEVASSPAGRAYTAKRVRDGTLNTTTAKKN